MMCYNTDIATTTIIITAKEKALCTKDSHPTGIPDSLLSPSQIRPPTKLQIRKERSS